MKPLPSRLKIALLSAGISGVVLVAFGVVLWLLISAMRLDAMDREIRTLASRHPGLFARRGNYDRLASSLEFTYGEDYTNHILLRLADAAGRTLYTSPHWPAAFASGIPGLQMPGNPGKPALGATDTNEAHVPARSDRGGFGQGGPGRGFGLGRGAGGPPPEILFNNPPRFLTATMADATWRFGVLGNDDMTLVIGLNQQEVDHELNQVRNAFLLTLPAALFLVGLGGWLVAGRALSPLQTIANTAEHMTARGLGQRIPQSTESPEAARLIQVLNRMMDRLEASFRQATRFSADASHELKTPLAVMQGELENALQTAEPGSPTQQLCSSLLEETQRLKNITRSLLLLAQADAGHLRLTLEPVDVSKELEALVEDARVLAADLGLAFEVLVPSPVRVEADRALLRTALFNLLSNAIKYNDPRGRISIRLDAEDRRAVLTLGNTGSGIPPADQPKIFDRFFRVDRTHKPRSEGSGLGLSLAREIVRAHGGDLTLAESRPGWTCFVLALPRSVSPSTR